MATTAGKAKSKPAKPKAKAPEPQWVQLTTRLSPKDAERLRKLAQADERPLMQYIRRVLEQHLQTQKGK